MPDTIPPPEAAAAAPSSPPTDVTDFLDVPQPERPHARRARRILDLAAAEDAPGANGNGDAPPFTLEDDAGAAGAHRKGGHKPTKAELEEKVRELERDRAALAGERPPEAAVAEVTLRPALVPTFTAIFGMVAAARGAHWRLEPAEAEQLSEAWAPVLAPYIGSAADSLPWLTAASVTYHILERRITADRERGRREVLVEAATTEPTRATARGPAPAPEPRAPEPAGGATRPLDPPGSGTPRPLDPPGYVPPSQFVA